MMGSELMDGRGKLVWSLRARPLINALHTFGRHVGALALPDGIGDDAPPDGVRAVGLMPTLHVIPGLWSPVSGYSGLMRFLRQPRFGLVEADSADPDLVPNLVTFPYDWRLSNRHNGRLLARTACDALAQWRDRTGFRDAELILVCHSMGGLVARWFLEREGGAELTRCLITIGTPHRGSVKALNTLSNGIEPGFDLFGLFGTQLNELAQSLPSLYQLLPTYPCLQSADGERRQLLTTGVPGVDTAMLGDAAEFHRAVNGAEGSSYAFHKVVGIRQPTKTTARMSGGSLTLSELIDGRQQGGDATVPRLAAEPVATRGQEVHEVADHHGELQGTRSVLDLLDGILTREEVIWEGSDPESFGVSMNEVWPAGSPPELVVPDMGDRRLRVAVLDEKGRLVGDPLPVRADGHAFLEPLPPGGYTARVHSPVRGGPPPVTRPFLVWDGASDHDEHFEDL